MRNLICLIVVFSVFISCRSNYFKLTGNNKSLSNAKLVDEIRTKVEKKPDQKFLLKEIVWNKECGCGLYDFTKIKKDSYNYFPILIDNTTVYWLKGDSLKLRGDSELMISEFFNKNESKLSKEDVDLIKKRLKKGVVHMGGTLMRSDLDIEADSVILNKYLRKDEKTISVKYR